MANDISADPWIIDTAAATVLSTNMLNIKSIRWVGATTAGHTAIIHDKDSNVIWSSVASGANYVESEIVEQWVHGLIVPTLASGVLYIQLA